MKRSLLLFATLLACAMPLARSSADVSFSVNIAPPALQVEEQPLCPTEGYLWTPGYWAYDDGDYYWVPGVWVAPPAVGLLWTPGYWGYRGGLYGFYDGYWGPTVGFYGGINYGYGYGGRGYYGGRWDGGTFRYNTAVTRVNTTVIHNTYEDRSFHNVTSGRTSFNGPGGVHVQPNAQERAAMTQRHIAATGAQLSHRQEAAQHRVASVPARAETKAASHTKSAAREERTAGASRVNHAAKTRSASANRVTRSAPHTRATHAPRTSHVSHQATRRTQAARPRAAARPQARRVAPPKKKK